MSNVFSSTWRTFWHAMTSDDRHASHDSPYRTGRHVPLSQSRHEPLTSVATSAFESRPDLTDLYDSDKAKMVDSSMANGWPGTSNGANSPSRPYSPGMRSLSSQKRQSHEQGVDTGDIQMQSFHDGAPPPPPITHSWAKIDRWLENNYEELYDNICEGCTQNDINELEHELDCSLPLEVRESWMIHDGQERPGLPTGLAFGCMLLDCEEIVEEWKNWRTVNEEFFSNSLAPSGLDSATVAENANASSAGSSTRRGSNSLWKQDLQDRQDSQPPGAVQKAYTHPGWIPVARDWGGNYIAIDLAPGPTGKWGQVIIYGRDYDCKYVVSRSWSGFLAILADDICSGKVIVDEETHEMKLKEFKNVEPPYLEILRWRTDQRYGRKQPRRKGPNGTEAGVNGRTGKGSPYGSPAASNEERGRSAHRFPSRTSTQSPKTQFGGSSPLARVTEEAASPLKVNESGLPEFIPNTNGESRQSDDLMDVTSSLSAPNKENERPAQMEPVQGLSSTDKSQKLEPSKLPSVTLDSEVLGEMKNVAI